MTNHRLAKTIISTPGKLYVQTPTSQGIRYVQSVKGNICDLLMEAPEDRAEWTIVYDDNADMFLIPRPAKGA